MSGFAGRIICETGRENCEPYVGPSIHLAAKQEAWCRTQGIANLSRTYSLTGGAYAVVALLNLGKGGSGLRAIYINAPSGAAGVEELLEPPPVEGTTGPGVLDVISGKVINAEIITEQLTVQEYQAKLGENAHGSVHFTDPAYFDYSTPSDSYRQLPTAGNWPPSTEPGGTPDASGKINVDLLTAFTPTTKTSQRYTNYVQRMRLAVDEYATFKRLITPGGDVDLTRYSEHAHVLPTMYTGTMRKVVQLLLGYGKIFRPTAEDKWIRSGTKRSYLSKSVDSGFGLYENPPYVKTTLKYDYRVSRTHGISFDSTGVPWLIEVGLKGVHALRLYLDPVSQITSGRKRYTDVSPELDEFFKHVPGIPLGWSFPGVVEDFEKWKRAGEVTELVSEMDMRTFYSKGLYGTEMGWAFNTLGSQAHNTCWEYTLDGVKRGYHYSVDLKLTKEVMPAWTDKTKRIATYFTTFWERKKARRLNESQADALLALPEDKLRIEFDKLVVTPTLQGTGRLRLHRFGYLHSGAQFKYQPQFKYPEEMFGAVISFNFSPQWDGSSRVATQWMQRNVRCDTPMFVCWIQGRLELICYTTDNRGPGPLEPAEDTRGECQVTGTWKTVQAKRSLGVAGNFYASSVEWREEVYSQGFTSESVGYEVGAYPWWGQLHPFAMCHKASTRRVLYTETVTRESNPTDLQVLSVVVPMGDRNAYYFGRRHAKHDEQIIKTGQGTTQDSSHYDIYMAYHFLIAWVGGCFNYPSNVQGYQNLGCYGSLFYHGTDDSCYTEDLHSGFYVNYCMPPPATNFAPNWPAIPIPEPYFVHEAEPGFETCEIVLIADSEQSPKIVKKETDELSFTSFSSWWEKASPDDGGAMPTIKTTGSCLGGDILNCMDDFDGNLKQYGGPPYMLGMWNTCYTGVIE